MSSPFALLRHCMGKTAVAFAGGSDGPSLRSNYRGSHGSSSSSLQATLSPTSILLNGCRTSTFKRIPSGVRPIPLILTHDSDVDNKYLPSSEVSSKVIPSHYQINCSSVMPMTPLELCPCPPSSGRPSSIWSSSSSDTFQVAVDPFVWLCRPASFCISADTKEFCFRGCHDPFIGPDPLGPRGGMFGNVHKLVRHPLNTNSI